MYIEWPNTARDRTTPGLHIGHRRVEACDPDHAGHHHTQDHRGEIQGSDARDHAGNVHVGLGGRAW